MDTPNRDVIQNNFYLFQISSGFARIKFKYRRVRGRSLWAGDIRERRERRRQAASWRPHWTQRVGRDRRGARNECRTRALECPHAERSSRRLMAPFHILNYSWTWVKVFRMPLESVTVAHLREVVVEFGKSRVQRKCNQTIVFSASSSALAVLELDCHQRPALKVSTRNDSKTGLRFCRSCRNIL